ncbi:MAG: GH92 family glycosyl hydrolase [Bacteroidota bacterium]
MTSSYLHLTILLFALCTIQCQISEPEPTKSSLLQYVDPFIGTADHGHVYPGATVPFGMVQLSPDNGTAGWDWCSGYNWADSIIVGFSHTHLSGTGIGDLLDISVMPTLQPIDFTKQLAPRASSYAATFSHERETASPGYYAVHLDNQIQVQLTAGQRFGFHQYTFPNNSEATILLDLGFALNWDRPTKTQIKVVNDRQVTGYRYSTGWAKDQRVFFAIEFSEPFSKTTLADSIAITEDRLLMGRQTRAQFQFGDAQKVKMKVGISTADVAGAQAALAAVKSWDFVTHRKNAEALWEKELNKIEVTTTNDSLKTIFYTALYRTCLAPTILEDSRGNYKGADGNIHGSEGYQRYGLFSLWDTFRACNPLVTITQPDKINDFVRSMLAHYEEYGLLPVWDLLANETNTMTGYHAIPVITDAYLKGYRDYDVEKVYAAMKKSSMQDIRGTDLYRANSYIPHDLAGQSVTRTLEYAFDDWCIAQMAKAMGKEADYQTYLQRSLFYKNLYDESTGFMRAKLADGSWKVPFDPQYSSHDFSTAEYTEGNAWQHSWFVPHAAEELIDLHGGNAAFVTKLDSLFSVDSEIRGDFTSADISGLIGQYAHGNEPSHHIAYLYNYADRFDKTQEQIREICHTQYNATPHGLCGNEDCGQMSAWYVFSAMGLYPMNPASGRYDFGACLFDQVVINLADGQQLTIVNENPQKNASEVSLNGQLLTDRWITHEQLTAGGTLRFVVGD